MKLIYRIILRISIIFSLIIAAWALLFYMAIIDEVNDEVDDSLDDYSEMLIVRALSGEELPTHSDGSNNQYYLTQVSESYTHNREKIMFADSMVYIREKGETEPARVMATIFEDAHGGIFELTVSTPTIEKKDLKESILYWTIFLYVALLLTIVTVSIVVFHRSMRPLYAVLNWLKSYRMGQRNEPLKNTTRITEFKKLNEAVIRHAQRNEELFEQQKQFIGNASHELQTPLAICRTRLELLMEDESLTEKQLGEIIGVHRTLEQITKLNKSLLLLLKIDNEQFAEISKVDIISLIARYLEDLKEVYAHKKITVEMDNADVLEVSMNEYLATTLVVNLLKNAFTHNIEGGDIRIVASGRSIVICNSGRAVPLDSERIFERFYQGSGNEESTGLGLAIIHSICKLHKISISYSYEGGEHCFKIVFSN